MSIVELKKSGFFAANLIEKAMLNRQHAMCNSIDIIMVADARSTFASEVGGKKFRQATNSQDKNDMRSTHRTFATETTKKNFLDMRLTGKNAMENKKKIDAMMKELLPDMPSIVTVDEEREDLQETISRLLAKLEVTKEELRSNSRKPHLVDARCMMAAYLIGLPSVRQVDIAAILGVSQAAVSKMLKRHNEGVKYYPPYRRKWESIDC